MSKILSIHTLKLCPGVSEEEFKTFVTEELSTYFWHTAGYSHHVLKGSNGNHVGQYILIFCIEGDKARKHYFAPQYIKDAIQKRLHEIHPENQRLMDKLNSMVSGLAVDFTDYVQID